MQLVGLVTFRRVAKGRTGTRGRRGGGVRVDVGRIGSRKMAGRAHYIFMLLIFMTQATSEHCNDRKQIARSHQEHHKPQLVACVFGSRGGSQSRSGFSRIA